MNNDQKPSHRIEKVNALLQQLVGEILLTEVQLLRGMITVTRVEASRDLKWAKVFVSIVGADDDKSSDNKILELIQKHMYDIQGEVNRRMEMKIVPRLQFFLDTTPRYAEHINELIKQIHSEEKEENDDNA